MKVKNHNYNVTKNNKLHVTSIFSIPYMKVLNLT